MYATWPCPLPNGRMGEEMVLGFDAARAEMATFRAVALQPDAIGRAILHAIVQPADVDTTEIVVRPVGNPA